MVIPVFFGVVIFLTLAGSSRAEEWTQFRGPTGQGLAQGRSLPLEWDQTRNIAWKQAIPGSGWSSPVLHRDRVYLTTAVASDAQGSAAMSLRTICLEESTGRVLWNTEVFSPANGALRKHNKNSHASPTPLIADERIYVHFGNQGTACLDLKGEVQWRNNTLPYPPVHGGGGSPVLVEKALIFSCDGDSDPFIVALDKQNGRLLWKTERKTEAKKKFSFSTPLVISVNGKSQVISPGSGAVFAYDPKNGREIWRVRYGEGYSVVPRPVFGHGMLFLSSGFDRPSVLAIRPNGLGDVTDTHIAWTLTKGAPNTPSLLLVGEELYMVSDGGIGSCVDARSGRVHWQERLGGDYSASPVHSGGRIYFLNEQGTSVVIKAGKEFEKLATNPLGERALASCAVSDGALFIRTEGYLYKIKG